MRYVPILVGGIFLCVAIGCGGGGSSRSKGNTAPNLAAITTPQMVTENVSVSFTVTATDNEMDPIVLTASPLPPTASFVDNGNGTGDFDFTPTPSQVGTTVTVTFGADDSSNPVVTQAVDFIVSAAPNLPPTLTVPPSPQMVAVPNTLLFQISATDPELDPIILMAINLPTNSMFTDNGNGTGDFDFTPDPTQAGMSFLVNFSADDGINPLVNQVVQIDVTNQPPTLNPITSPRIAPAQTVHMFTVSATDPEMDPLTMTAMNVPTGAGFVDNLNGTGDFTFFPDLTQVGMTFTITFGADDGTNPAVTQMVDIDVVAPNLPPVLTIIPSPQAVAQAGNLTINVMATDPDLDPITLSASRLPTNSTFTDGGGGMGTFDFNPDFVQSGSFYVIFSASDGITAPTSQVVQVDVTGNGTGTLTEALPNYSYGTMGWGLASADFDGDGIIDVATVDGDAATAGLVIGIGNDVGGGIGNGTFMMSVESPYSLVGASADPIPRHLAIGDFNNDSVPDVAIIARPDADLHIWLGDVSGGPADGTFTNYAPGFIDFTVTDDVFHITTADLDEDGNADLVTGGATGPGNMYVLLGDGAGAFAQSSQSPIQASTAGGDPVHVAIGDVNGDDIPDIVAVNISDAAMLVFLGDDDGTGRNSAGTFTQTPSPVTTPVPSPSQPSLADFNRDGRLDVAIPHFELAAVFTIWLGDGTGDFIEAPARPSIGALAEYSGTGDFNGDGIPDIVASNAGGAAQLHVLTGNGNGTFTAMAGSPFALSTAGRVLSVNDFNNDGIADISVACQGDGVVQAAVHIFLGG
ncbi:MAG: FG-GAP-like repeat-containing protein [Planctomycetota bacterium]|nr:FG-GAP-like repeat-containing protein [Planctomycetota bacterium]